MIKTILCQIISHCAGTQAIIKNLSSCGQLEGILNLKVLLRFYCV